MSVHRCVCHSTTFAELLPRCRANEWSDVATIMQHTKCGSGCGGCKPYLEVMLKTGATSFAVRDANGVIAAAPLDPWDIADR